MTCRCLFMPKVYLFWCPDKMYQHSSPILPQHPAPRRGSSGHHIILLLLLAPPQIQASTVGPNTLLSHNPTGRHKMQAEWPQSAGGSFVFFRGYMSYSHGWIEERNSWDELSPYLYSVDPLFWSKFCWLLLYYGGKTAASGSMELLLIPFARVVLDAFVLVYASTIRRVRFLVDEPCMDINIFCKSVW
jgi:hypothetical protein